MRGLKAPFKGAERRLRTRFRVRVPFTLRGNSHAVRGTTRNVSLLGISAYTEQPLSPVQPVQCLLELPRESHPIPVSGTVIRCEPLLEPNPDGSYEMGVFFKEFQQPAEAALSRFLNQIEKEEQEEVKVGYFLLKKRIAERRRRKRLEELRKRRRRQARLRRRRLRLAREKRLKAQRRRQRAMRKAARLAAKKKKKKGR